MKESVRISFFVNYSLSNEIQNFFKVYDIHIDIPERKLAPEFLCSVHIDENTDQNLNDFIREIITDLKTKLNIKHIGEYFYVECSDNEYEEAPFFRVSSTGNSAKAHLDDEGINIKKELFCSDCGLQFKQLQENLTVNTAVLKSKLMINVGGQFWVVSERMAQLMEEWGLKGYSLREVIHKGKAAGSVPGYQLLPTTVLPPWSDKMRHYFFVDEEDEYCTACGVKGRVDYPYHYDKSQIETVDTDLAWSKEFTNNGSYAYHSLLISSRFRRLLLDHKLSRDVRSMFDKSYGRNDWFLEPVIVVNE